MVKTVDLVIIFTIVLCSNPGRTNFKITPNTSYSQILYSEHSTRTYKKDNEFFATGKH